MAVENFTNYTEEDPGDDITVTTNKVEFTTLPRSARAYVYDDKGVDHFDGDFEHLLTINTTAEDNYSTSLYWCLFNSIGDLANAGDGLHLTLRYNSGLGEPRALRIYEVYSSTAYYSSAFEYSLDTDYYLKIKRDESVGTYGTIYCDVYTSEADRTNEENAVGNLSVTLHSKQDLRYIYALQSNYNVANHVRSGYIQNLDLQEEAATNIKSYNGLLKASIKSINGLAIADIKSINGLA